MGLSSYLSSLCWVLLGIRRLELPCLYIIYSSILLCLISALLPDTYFDHILGMCPSVHFSIVGILMRMLCIGYCYQENILHYIEYFL